MGHARIRLTGDLVREVFHFPPDTEIVGSRECVGDVELVVFSPDLPAVTNTSIDEVPIKTPTFRSVRRQAPVFEGW